MNAIDLLKKDHEHVNELFDQIMEADEFTDRRQIFDEVRNELELHTHAEETVLYPIFEKRPEFHELIEEAYDEHQEVRDLLGEISVAIDEDHFDERFDELMDAVQAHVDEEEEELFPRMERILSDEELHSIGARLEDAKRNAPTQIAA